jgi:uncharacterized protein YqeY
MNKDVLNAEITAALRAHDKARLSILRLVKCEVDTKEKAEKRVVADEEVVAALKKVLRQTGETLEGSIKAGTNEERTALLQEQVDILSGYLPKQVSGDELVAVVDAVLAESGLVEKREMGKAIALVVAATGGNCDKAEVARIVGARLSSADASARRYCGSASGALPTQRMATSSRSRPFENSRTSSRRARGRSATFVSRSRSSVSSTPAWPNISVPRRASVSPSVKSTMVSPGAIAVSAAVKRMFLKAPSIPGWDSRTRAPAWPTTTGAGWPAPQWMSEPVTQSSTPRTAVANFSVGVKRYANAFSFSKTVRGSPVSNRYARAPSRMSVVT